MVEIAENIKRRIVAYIRNNVIKLYRNCIWGHIIYRPIRRARWKIPRGMKTLDEFLDWHRERQGVEQVRRDHPVALETYLCITTDHILSKKEVGMISSLLGEALFDEMFSGELIDLMEWGHEYTQVTEPEDTKAGWRVSRDGEYFPPDQDLMRKRWFKGKWDELGYE